eukprot:1735024-Amphidinium_carterae.1
MQVCQGRVIHLKVDAEITALLRELPSFEDFDHHKEVLKPHKSAYGLVDAHRHVGLNHVHWHSSYKGGELERQQRSSEELQQNHKGSIYCKQHYFLNG